MQGSLYPNGVLIDRTALRRTETSKAAEILRTRTDVTSRGVYSGGVITVNAVNTDRIDIAAFSGYTPRGDYIEETGSLANIALADYTATTVNVICAVYTESNIHNQPHETDGSTYPTEAEGTYRIRLFTQANFDNPAVLSTTDDNLQNDAKDRCLVLGKVTAEGAGNPLSASTLQHPTTFDNVLYTNPQTLVTLTGVTILDVDPNTPTGTGTITFDDTGAPPYNFQYTSPGGVISIASPVNADSVVTITDGSGYWIRIQVIISQLPLGLVVPYAETFQIINLYYQAVPRLTAEDKMHRSYLGTGIVTPYNPHGNSIDDFAGVTISLLDEHQDVMHCNGIWRGSSSNLFLGSINTLTAGGDTLTIVAPGATDLFYVNGVKSQALSPTQVIFDAATFTSGYFGAAVAKEGSKLIEFYVDDSETLVPNTRVEYPDPRNCIGTWIVDISPTHPAGNFDLRLTVVAGVSLTVRWGDTDSYEEVVPAPTVTGITGQIVRLYHPNNSDWIDLYLGDDSGVGEPFLPGAGTYTDTITVHAALDRADNMQFMSVPYWYNTVGPRGSIGYPPNGVVRALTDNRIWGNLCIDQFADEALNKLIYYPTYEYNRSGLLNRRHLGYRSDWQFTNLSAPSLQIRQWGGVCYIRGKRLDVAGEDAVLVDNQTTIVWVDHTGTLQYDDFSAAPFTGSYQQAIEWLVGYPQDRDIVKHPDYIANTEVTPQRGLPLYVITTLAGAVTATFDLTRYVGTHVKDWTVGQDTQGAQFESLEAAFAYAAHEQEASAAGIYNITIKLVGNSVITTTITQPSYVTVEGNWNASTEITVTPSAPDNSGSWRLSSNAVVRNVRLTNAVAGPVFGLANDAVLDHVHCVASAGNFASLNSSAIRVMIMKCFIQADLGMFYVPGVLGNVFSLMKIKDCLILSTSSQGNSLIRLDRAEDCEISNNYIAKSNANTNIDPVIDITLSPKCLIEDNFIEIGPGDGTLIEKGIYVTTSDDVQVKGNFVQRTSGSTSIVGVGIQVSDGSNVIISDNVVDSMACGILVGAIAAESAYFEDTTISNNVVTAAITTGIRAYANTAGTVANTISGLRIEGNQIHKMSKADVVDTLFGYALSGVMVIANNASFVAVRDIVIQNNTIDSLTNLKAAGNSPTYGVYFSVTASILVDSKIDSIQVDNNTISRLDCTALNDKFGIFSNIYSGDYPVASGEISNCSYSRNNIVLTSSNSAGLGLYARGIDCETSSNGGVDNPLTFRQRVDNNNIYVLTAAPYTATGDGIVVRNDTSYNWRRSTLNNNTIYVPWYGIRAGMIEQSTIDNNKIIAGSVGIYAPIIDTSSISGNILKITSNNQNGFLRIDSTNYGQMGILVTAGYSTSLIRNNQIELHENASTNRLMRGSCSIALTGGGLYFEVEGNKSIHHYTDIAAGGGGTEQAFHIYVADPDYAWTCSSNVIYNDSFYQTTPSKSHSLYIAFPGGVATATRFRGVVDSNKIYGSNLDTDAHYELFIGAYGGGGGNERECYLMNNYIGLYAYAHPAVTTEVLTSWPATTVTTGANIRERIVAPGNWGSILF